MSPRRSKGSSLDQHFPITFPHRFLINVLIILGSWLDHFSSICSCIFLYVFDQMFRTFLINVLSFFVNPTSRKHCKNNVLTSFWENKAPQKVEKLSKKQSKNDHLLDDSSEMFILFWYRFLHWSFFVKKNTKSIPENWHFRIKTDPGKFCMHFGRTLLPFGRRLPLFWSLWTAFGSILIPLGALAHPFWNPLALWLRF